MSKIHTEILNKLSKSGLTINGTQYIDSLLSDLINGKRIEDDIATIFLQGRIYNINIIKKKDSFDKRHFIEILKDLNFSENKIKNITCSLRSFDDGEVLLS